MDEFSKIASQVVTGEFERLSKAAEALSDAERMAYNDKFPIRIWMVAGPSEDLAFAISAN